MGRMASAAGLSEGEHLVLKLHQHWKTVLMPLLILAATVVALLVLLLAVPSVRDAAAGRLALGAVALVVVIVFVAVPLLRWRTTSYELTNRRLGCGPASSPGRAATSR